MHYGFIGLGNLGRHLAGSLIREGFTVTVSDLNPAATEVCNGRDDDCDFFRV